MLRIRLGGRKCPIDIPIVSRATLLGVRGVEEYVPGGRPRLRPGLHAGIGPYKGIPSKARTVQNRFVRGSVHQQPAIDRKRLAHDVAAGRGRKKQYSGRNFSGCTQTPDRCICVPAQPLFLRSPGAQ